VGESHGSFVEDGDRIFLCSDGVWDLVSANEIAEIVETLASLQSGADAIMDLIFLPARCE
jgi:protein phosphatase